MSTFAKNKGNLLFMDVYQFAASPWKRYLAQQDVQKYILS